MNNTKSGMISTATTLDKINTSVSSGNLSVDELKTNNESSHINEPITAIAKQASELFTDNNSSFQMVLDDTTGHNNDTMPVQVTNETSQLVKEITLNDFNLLKVIGRGSYAKVFLVEYKRTKKCYAMKCIKKSMVNDDEDIDWIQTEKHVFEQATNHPFLVGLHSCFQTQSRLFFVIEYLCGGDLMYHMQRKRKLPEDHARFYSAEIVIALDFLHSKG
jgi:hypothetical protein